MSLGKRELLSETLFTGAMLFTILAHGLEVLVLRLHDFNSGRHCGRWRTCRSTNAKVYYCSDERVGVNFQMGSKMEARFAILETASVLTALNKLSVRQIAHNADGYSGRAIPLIEYVKKRNLLQNADQYLARMRDAPLTIGKLKAILTELKKDLETENKHAKAEIDEIERKTTANKNDQLFVKNDLGSAKGAIKIANEQWVARQELAPVEVISKLRQALEQVVRLCEKTNLPEDELVLTKIERAELLAMLETALTVLNAPLTPTSFMEATKDALEEVGGKVAKEKGEKALGKGVDVAIARLIEVFARYWSGAS